MRRKLRRRGFLGNGKISRNGIEIFPPGEGAIRNYKFDDASAEHKIISDTRVTITRSANLISHIRFYDDSNRASSGGVH